MGMLDAVRDPRLHLSDYHRFAREVPDGVDPEWFAVSLSEHMQAHQAANDRVSGELGGLCVIDFSEDWRQLIVRMRPATQYQRDAGINGYAAWSRDTPVVQLFAPEGRLRAEHRCQQAATLRDVVAYVGGTWGEISTVVFQETVCT